MTTKADELDATARSFLGTDDVKVMPGQVADQKKLAKQQHQELIREACTFGDEVTAYITLHKDHALPVLAYATCLSVLALRTEYPDGYERFDEWAQRGGNDLVLEVKDATISEPYELSTKDMQEGVVLAKTFAKEITRTHNRLNANNAQAAYGLGRAFQNLRLTFPPEFGGVEAFDKYAQEAGQYLLEDIGEGRKSNA